MNETAETILKNAYEEFIKTKRPYLCIFPSSANERFDYNEALDYLKSDGYIKIGRRAIGMADVTLTQYGIDYIED